jgi:hypothetical protein
VRIERIAEMLDDWTVSDRRKLAELLARFTTPFEQHDPARAGAARRDRG